jgi:hypothetical protein
MHDDGCYEEVQVKRDSENRTQKQASRLSGRQGDITGHRTESAGGREARDSFISLERIRATLAETAMGKMRDMDAMLCEKQEVPVTRRYHIVT